MQRARLPELGAAAARFAIAKDRGDRLGLDKAHLSENALERFGPERRLGGQDRMKLMMDVR